MTLSCEDCGKQCERRSWRQRRCRACAKIAEQVGAKSYRERNAAKLAEKSRRWRRENPEKAEALDRRKAAARTKEQRAAEYVRTTEAIKQRARDWYARNRETVLARRTTPEGRERARQRELQKRAQPGYRLHQNMSRAIRAGLRGQKGWRSWQALVGYTLDDLQQHIERQFDKRMRWENYGAWVIDHIRPRSQFEFNDPTDPAFAECWALSNLRPLWAAENAAKGGARQFLI